MKITGNKLALAVAFGAAALFAAAGIFSGAAKADTIATDPNSLLVGATSFDLRDYENLYDSNGNIVTTRLAQAGDTLQGVFIIMGVTNAAGAPVYSPAAGNSAVEITGVFSEYVSGIDSKGNYILTPDNTTTVGSKAISGTGFQAQFGANSMLAVYSNNSNAMRATINGNGLASVTSASAAYALAESGSEWASFGGINTTGGTTGWGAGNGYFWAANQTGIGVATFAASLGMIQNDTAFPTSSFLPIAQNSPNPPAGGVDTNINGTGFLSNVFAIQGTTNTPAIDTWMGSETVYGIGSTDPAQFNLVPEPSSIALLGALGIAMAFVRPLYRRLRG